MLDRASGVWTSLAMDMADGLSYRPLVGEGGYGGTRYFPLHFLLHAALIKWGEDPVNSGYFLAIASAVALLFGVYFLLRGLGTPRRLAFCASPESGKSNRPRVSLAALFFTQAFAAKVTTVFGFLAAFAALFLSGRRKAAWRLCGLTVAERKLA